MKDFFANVTNSRLDSNLAYEFRVLFSGALGIHLCLIFFGVAMGAKYYIIYQIAATLLYAGLIKFWSEKRFRSCCVLYFLEVTVNALLTSWCLGGTYSSELYLFVLIPAANSIVFTNYSEKAKYLYMIVNAVSCMIAFFVIDYLALYLFFNPAIYDISNYNDSYFLSRMLLETFHIATSVALLFATTLFFIGRIRKSISSVTSENIHLGSIAVRDELTGLFNRRKMEALLRTYDLQWKQQRTPFTVAMGDIDHFKSFNDTYGHAAGDAVLHGLANSLTSVLRDKDAVCRWGGEEFLFVFQCDQEIALYILERLRKKVEQTSIPFEGKSLAVSMTFGTSAIREGQTVEQLIAEADRRLYLGKKQGRNCVIGTDLLQ